MDAREPAQDGVDVPATPSPDLGRGDDRRDGDLIVEDVLVEDVSIDGMCGVY